MPESEFAWTTFLELAERLSGQEGAKEPELRTAVSRSYYAAYHSALSHCKRLNLLSPLAETAHAKVWRVFSEGPKREYRNISNWGTRLLQARVKADYELTKANHDWLDTSRAALDWAKRMIDLLGQMESSKKDRM